MTTPTTNRSLVALGGGAVAVLLILLLALGSYWSNEPEMFDVTERAFKRAEQDNAQVTVGYTSTATLIELADTLLEKPGGYLSNDRLPPSVFLDNIPNWEFGVLVQMRDFARAMRKDFSRSQSQSTEDPDLAIAEPQLHFDNNSWAFPASESEYRSAVEALENYLGRLSDPVVQDAQFYARADNLRNWLADVETRLGSLSQKLSASLPRKRLNTDLAGDAEASQSTPTPTEFEAKTPWTETDDVFYEARGSAWALLHLLKAVETDFGDTLDKKNARVSLRQIIRELEATQADGPLVVLNGDGFGMFANHSLVMASYIARANAAIIDLRELLSQG